MRAELADPERRAQLTRRTTGPGFRLAERLIETQSLEPPRAVQSVDGRDVGADESCLLLVDFARPAIGMALLKMRERWEGRDRIDLVIAVIVE